MPDIKTIMNALERIAPLSLQCEWDNSGLLVDSKREIESVLLCLDVTPPVIAEAVSRHADLIISHHPVIFKPLSSLKSSDPVYQLCQKNISCIAMHTNLDAAKGGVNDHLAELFGIDEPSLFENIGRIGRLKRDYSTIELVKKAAGLLSYSPRFYDSGSTIRTLAIVGGAGSMVDEAFNAGADLLLTGEVKHSDWLLAQRLGVSLIEAGHFATEWPVVELLYDRMYEMFDHSEIEFFVSAVEEEPTTLYMKGAPPWRSTQ